ncbi:thioesterase domain-containing protein [Streptomyces sp. DSM 44915]|uniref:Thioesterase domain-containing protein n=1 Tax=Streptomyces chisholmiae TaxID=3075540 RepID=A0ABU2JYN1_9ACTN|nr:alpha/beta fold hydrolase [Streptomyces sp. DSM 44915]MDT0270074.1 thioesterase domain-containing protein [Streptomyces sp. DSM 44915]
MNGTPDARPDRWLRWYRRVATPRLRLVCLPHAGGAPSLFRDWSAGLPADVEVVAVCYPGRQDRLAEPCVDDMGVLSTVIADVLLPYHGPRLALFGHSMGASVAYEVALRLQQRTDTGVAGLFVSGQLPPHRVVPSDVHRQGDDAILAAVRQLGDPGAEAVLADPDLRELVLPAIRADFRLIGGYQPRPVTPLRGPVAAYAGADDPDVPAAGLREWAAATADGPFHHRTLPGNHFYLIPGAAPLLADLSERLAELPAPG